MSFSVFYSIVVLLHFYTLRVGCGWGHKSLVSVGPKTWCVWPTLASQLLHTAVLKSTDSVVCVRNCDKLIIKVFLFGCAVWQHLCLCVWKTRENSSHGSTRRSNYFYEGNWISGPHIIIIENVVGSGASEERKPSEQGSRSQRQIGYTRSVCPGCRRSPLMI